MGNARDNMQSTVKPTAAAPSSDKASKGILGTLSGWGGRKGKGANAAANAAKSFADYVCEGYDNLQRLIVGKETDLTNERGSEDKNRISLSRLQAMSFFLDKVMSVIDEEANDSFGSLTVRRGSVVDKSKAADKFADLIVLAHNALGKLISDKEAELSGESVRKRDLALAPHQVMNYYIESTMDLIVEYAQS